jgi:hypothetical protein
MDRKGIIGILLAVIGLISWQIYFTRETNRALQRRKKRRLKPLETLLRPRSSPCSTRNAGCKRSSNSGGATRSATARDSSCAD